MVQIGLEELGLRELWDDLRSPSSPYHLGILVYGGESVGFFAILQTPFYLWTDRALELLWVHPKYRQQGIGRSFVQRELDFCRYSQWSHRFSCAVHEDHTEFQILLHSLGVRCVQYNPNLETMLFIYPTDDNYASEEAATKTKTTDS